MRASSGYVQVKEVSEKNVAQMGDNNLKLGEVISLGIKTENPIQGYPFKKGDKILFDTNKSLKHDGLWYLKADSVLAYDGN